MTSIKIGVTGTYCSGKDSFADYLLNKGFEHLSLSDILRDELRSRGLEVNRENLINLGNELREKEGADSLAVRAAEKMKNEKSYIITSIRNPLEVKKLSALKNFILINIDAPIKERFKRLIAREDIRKEDKANLTFEKFVESECKEMESKEEHSQKIKNCVEMAKLTIVNDGRLEDFHKRIDDMIPKIEEIASCVRPG